MAVVEPTDGRVYLSPVGEPLPTSDALQDPYTWAEVGYTTDTRIVADDIEADTLMAGKLFQSSWTTTAATVTFSGRVSPALRYIIAGKPQKWMHKRARDFRADRRKYRRWLKGTLP